MAENDQTTTQLPADAEAAASQTAGAQPTAPASPTEQIPPAAESPQPSTPEAATFHDVASTAGSFARGRLARLETFLATHRLALAAAALALVVAAALLALAVRRLLDYPTASRQDVAAHLAAPAYSGGAYGHDDAPLLSDVRQTARHKDARTPNKCQLTVVATYASDAVEALQEATLTYERGADGWACVAAEPTGSASFRATAGVSEDKLAANVAGLLQRAEASLAQDEATTSSSLPALYGDADVAVTGASFDEDAQTASADLHLTRSSAFTAHECDLHATFAFRPGNGLWELTSATVSPGAKDVQLTPLVGTWEGTFRAQAAADGKCFGAKEAGLQVSIGSVSGQRIAGTLSGVAHYHADLSADAEATEGDAALSAVPFQGTLVDGGAQDISFACTTPEDARGSVTLTLTFGTPEDPTAATATLTTTHAYTATFLLIPYQREATFSDTYVLTRQ